MSIVDEVKKSFKSGSALIKLIYINIAVFLAVKLIGTFITLLQLNTGFSFITWFAVPADLSNLIYKPWTILTYMFLHGGFLHLLMNMLWLFWLGIIFLRYFNNKQLLAVYLIGGFTGALLHLCINILLSVKVGIIGASAATMAVVFAVASYKPNYVIQLLFIGPVKMKYIALFAFVLDLMGIVGNLKSGMGFGDGIAHFAHLGGAFYGLWFGYEMRKGKDITRKFNNLLNEFVSFFSSRKNSVTKKSENTR